MKMGKNRHGFFGQKINGSWRYPKMGVFWQKRKVANFCHSLCLGKSEFGSNTNPWMKSRPSLQPISTPVSVTRSDLFCVENLQPNELKSKCSSKHLKTRKRYPKLVPNGRQPLAQEGDDSDQSPKTYLPILLLPSQGSNQPSPPFEPFEGPICLESVWIGDVSGKCPPIPISWPVFFAKRKSA